MNSIPELPPLPSTPVTANPSDPSRPTLPGVGSPGSPSTPNITDIPDPPGGLPNQPRLPPPGQPSKPPGIPAPTYDGPLWGVLTWTGDIDKNGTIVIEGGQASSGTLKGKLPSVPVILDINTKEFALAEVPSPSNGWNRLVIRSRNKRQTTISINWRIPRQ
jgi:hypothetical protein